MTDDLTQIKKRFIELAKKCETRGVYCGTGFLTLAEQGALAELKGALSGVPYVLFGGADGCERKLLQFGSEALCGYEQAPPVACVKITPANPRFSDALTHRDYLGALMNLGLKRETLGDIVLEGDACFIFCTEGVAPYIVENLTTVKRTTVRAEATNAFPKAAAARLSAQAVQIASERLDALIARAFSLSREESAELFRISAVFINGAPAASPSAAPQMDDIISVRGHGRFAYRGISGTTRKGKLRANIDLYES